MGTGDRAAPTVPGRGGGISGTLLRAGSAECTRGRRGTRAAPRRARPRSAVTEPEDGQGLVEGAVLPPCRRLAGSLAQGGAARLSRVGAARERGSSALSGRARSGPGEAGPPG